MPGRYQSLHTFWLKMVWRKVIGFSSTCQWYLRYLVELLRGCMVEYITCLVDAVGCCFYVGISSDWSCACCCIWRIWCQGVGKENWPCRGTESAETWHHVVYLVFDIIWLEIANCHSFSFLWNWSNEGGGIQAHTGSSTDSIYLQTKQMHNRTTRNCENSNMWKSLTVTVIDVLVSACSWVEAQNRCRLLRCNGCSSSTWLCASRS